MATHHGKDGHINVGANQVAETTEWSVDEEVETVDDTAQGDTAKTHLVGVPSWSGRCTAFWDETDTNGQEALTIGASFTFNGYPEGDASGASYMTGTATVTRIGVGVPKDGVVTRDIEFQGNGALTHGTVGS